MRFHDLGHGELLMVLPVQKEGLLWIREPWQVLPEFNGLAPREIKPTKDILYIADREYIGSCWDSRERHPKHMPKWASRITLEVTGVGVRRKAAKSEAIPTHWMMEITFKVHHCNIGAVEKEAA